MSDVTENQTPAADQSGADEAQAPKALSIRQRLAQLVAGEEAAAELVAAKQQLADVTAERDGLASTVASLQAEVAKLKSDLSDAEQAVADFEKNVQAAAVEKAKKLTIDAVAAAGIPAAELPAASASGEDKVTKLRAELAATTDSAERGKIAAQLAALRQWSN